MLTGMYTAVSAMLDLQTSQTVITNNMANVNTTGFKAEKVIYKTFDDVLVQNNDNHVNGKGTNQQLGILNPGVKIDEIKTNYEQGNIIETGNKTDFAINGKGFFTVRDEEEPLM